MGEFLFGQSVQKLPGNYGILFFYETYSEESNINRKLLIWSLDKIKTKFGPKKWVIWYTAKCTKTARKLRKSFILENLLRRE